MLAFLFSSYQTSLVGVEEFPIEEDQNHGDLEQAVPPEPLGA
jgi:hypothetical protein